jgi:hypothetical protein
MAVQGDYNPLADPLSQVQNIVQEALDENSESIQQQSDFKSIVGDELFASIEGQEEFIQSWMRYLKKYHASEAQWESIIWRPWFLRGALQPPPGDDRSDSKPFVGQIVQAKMTLSAGGAVLPPLLATGGARRKSGLIVAPVPWVPDLKRQKGNHILWYPDYLYAVSESSLKSRLGLRKLPNLSQIPAFRLAQRQYLPANWLAEIKAEDTETNHLAAENYSALMSAYLLHERLLLRWIAKNQSMDSTIPVEFDDSLAVHCITCCGPTCKI